MKKSIVKSYLPYLWILFLGAVVYYGIEFRWLLRDFISADTSNYKRSMGGVLIYNEMLKFV